MLSIIGIVVKIFGVIAKFAPLLFAYSAGKKSASLKNAQESLKKSKARIKMDTDIARLDATDHRSRLQRWFRK